MEEIDTLARVGGPCFLLLYGPLVIIVLFSFNASALEALPLEQASGDLGAVGWMTVRRITVPLILPAVLAGTLLGFTLSFHGVTVTLFLAGGEPTLPVYIWNQLRFGLTSAINAVFASIGLVSLVLIVTATRLMNRSRGEAGKSFRVAGAM